MISDGVKGVARVSGCYDFHKGIVTAGDSGSCWGVPSGEVPWSYVTVITRRSFQ